MNRFVIIGHGRTGSNLLSRALNAHNNCLAFSELFHENIADRRDACLGRIHHFTGATDAITYLSREVYALRKGIEAVGFTLFYDQARACDAERDVWHYLLRNTDITVIHLQRRQLLEAWLSYEIARYTDQWFIASDDTSTTTVDQLFKIDARELEQFFDLIYAQRSWVNKAFEHHRVEQLFYEDDLCNRFTSALNRLYQQLWLNEHAVVPSSKKQTMRSSRQLIENWYDSAQHFSMGPYAHYFEYD